MTWARTKKTACEPGRWVCATHAHSVSRHGRPLQGPYWWSAWAWAACAAAAARGIDIAQLPAVVNYDLPRSAVDYVHRIGRTGRAGESGMAVSFVTADAEAHFRLIEKRQHLTIPREQITGFEPTETPQPASPVEPQGTGGIKGKRPSKKDKLRAAAAAQAAQAPADHKKGP